MKEPRMHTDESVPQSVTDFIKIPSHQESIQIGFTDQRVSPHAGLAPFIGFLHWHQLTKVLEKLLPHAPTSNHANNPTDTALGFVMGILSGAKKLAEVAYLRGDQVLAKLLRVECLPSQPTLTRFFQVFDGAALNLRTFDPLWRWCLERLNSRAEGYTLDLDSTQLVHEDHHHAQGIRTGQTPLGMRRCWNPLLGFIAEAKLVCGFWLRPGNTISFNNVVGFTLGILERLPRYVRIGLVRADSGFCYEEWLQLLEDKGLRYIVVGRLYRPVRSLIRKQQQWQSTDVEGTEVCDLIDQQWSWRSARRMILVRHRVAQKERPGGKMLIELPGYLFQVLITNLGAEVAPIDVWRRYNGRAGSENIIKELDAHFALPQLCLKNFWSSEAALSLAVFTYNLCVLFQRHLGWTDRVSAATLRFRVFVTAGIVSRTGGVDTIRLAVPCGQRAWWQTVFEKLISPFPNCNSIEPWPDWNHRKLTLENNQ
jgi:hypothetical protein